MIDSIMHYEFMQNAFIACLLASIVCGIIGVIVVEKHLVMMSGGIAHTAYGGVGLGYFLGIEPIFGAFFFALCAALGIGYMKRKGKVYSDVIISLFWSLGMAMGILFIGFMPGYPPDMSSYLFGSILSVTKNDIYLMVILTIVVVLIISSFFHYWQSYLFDEEFATVIGMKTGLLEYGLLILIAMTVVVMLRVVGIILVIALLSAPAATAALFTKKLKSRMLLAVLFSGVFCLSGLWISYKMNIASGASIVVLSIMGYLTCLLIHFLLRKRSAMRYNIR